MGSFKHNKKRNTGLTYEFLIRRLSQSMVEKDDSGYRRTMEIVRKYYGEGAPLSEERELFDVIKNTRGVTERAARRILAEAQRSARSLDARHIDIKKSNLIKEINYAFGKNFFSDHRIPEYRLLASIQMVIDATRSQNRLTESVQKIQLEEGLVRYMTSRGSFSEAVTQRSEVDAVVMAMVAKKFNEKYERTLSVPQKRLLERYIRAQVTGDSRPLSEMIESEARRIMESLKRASTMKEIMEDATMSKKLEEAKQKFPAGQLLENDLAVEEIMMYQKLVEEVESDQ